MLILLFICDAILSDILQFFDVVVFRCALYLECLDQIHSHMSRFALYPPSQSAYRKGHSTETALLKLQNDILMNMNCKHVTLLVLVDLSAAFDTVDHNILLVRLKVARLDFLGLIPPKFEPYLRRHE